MNPRPATAAELRQFEKFDKLSRVYQLRVMISHHEAEKLRISQQFAREIGLDYNETLAAYDLLSLLQKRAVQFRRVVEGVKAEKLQLYFPKGPKEDFDIFYPDSLNEDEEVYYQFGIVFVASAIVLGVIGVASVWWTLDTHEVKNKEIHERFQAQNTLLNHKFCEDPNSDTCKRWMEFRMSMGYENHDTEIVKLGNEIGGILDSVGSTLSTGISWAIPVAAAVVAVMLLKDRK